jgi:hypothetical protein
MNSTRIISPPLMNQLMRQFYEYATTHDPPSGAHITTLSEISQTIQHIDIHTHQYVDNIYSYDTYVLELVSGVQLAVPVILYNDGHVEIDPTIRNLDVITICRLNEFIMHMPQQQQMDDVVLPLTEEALSQLEEHKFSDLKEKQNDDPCAICRDKYEPDSIVNVMKCGHMFHKECIVPWLKEYNHKCPICRSDCGKYKPTS